MTESPENGPFSLTIILSYQLIKDLLKHIICMYFMSDNLLLIILPLCLFPRILSFYKVW